MVEKGREQDWRQKLLGFAQAPGHAHVAPAAGASTVPRVDSSSSSSSSSKALPLHRTSSGGKPPLHGQRSTSAKGAGGGVYDTYTVPVDPSARMHSGTTAFERKHAEHVRDTFGETQANYRDLRR